MSESAHLPFDALNAALKAAGEDTRLRVLVLLAEAELTVSDLTQILRQSQPRISRHLKLLVEAGLVERFREGSWAFFRLAERGGTAEMARALVARLRPDDAMLVRDRERLAAVRQAPGASFELWSDKGRKYAARLRELSPSADSMTRTYPARFTVVEKPDFIGLGMTATLAFERSDLESAANVPLSAIFQRGTQPAVWVVDRTTGTVALRDVVIARWRDDTAAILSGVREGELIATAGVHKLEPGQRVRPVLQAAGG